MVLHVMSDILLISKTEAAALLGVSRATFDRARKRLGLTPAASIRVKPVMFLRADVLRAAGGPTTKRGLVRLPSLKKASRTARRAKR